MTCTCDIRKLNHFTESFNLIWFAIHEFKMIHRLFLDLQLWEIGLWAMLCHIYTLRFSPLRELLLSVLLLSTLWQAFLVVPDVSLVDQSALLSLFLNWQLSFFCLHLKLQYPVFEKLKAMTIKVHWLLLEYNKHPVGILSSQLFSLFWRYLKNIQQWCEKSLCGLKLITG